MTRSRAGHACPRCGYDQSGVIAAWTESCPLTGTCSECGLGLDWRDLLNSEFRFRREFFEHAQRSRARAWCRTLARSCRPGRFWRWVRLEHPIRPARLIGGALGGAALLCITSGAVVIGLYYLHALVLSRLWGYWPGSELVGPVVDRWYYHFLPPASAVFAELPGVWVWFVGLTLLLMPFTFLTLPITFRRARVRRLHLARIFLYGLAPYALACAAPLWIFHLGALGLNLARLLNASPYLWWTLERWGSVAGAVLLVLVPLAFIARWWHVAARDYLRLPRPGAITIALFIMSMTAAGAAAALLAKHNPALLFPEQVW